VVVWVWCCSCRGVVCDLFLLLQSPFLPIHRCLSRETWGNVSLIERSLLSICTVPSLPILLFVSCVVLLWCYSCRVLCCSCRVFVCDLFLFLHRPSLPIHRCPSRGIWRSISLLASLSNRTRPSPYSQRLSQPVHMCPSPHGKHLSLIERAIPSLFTAPFSFYSHRHYFPIHRCPSLPIHSALPSLFTGARREGSREAYLSKAYLSTRSSLPIHSTLLSLFTAPFPHYSQVTFPRHLESKADLSNRTVPSLPMHSALPPYSSCRVVRCAVVLLFLPCVVLFLLCVCV